MSKGNILVIEDEKKIARFIELELLHEGYCVEVNNNGLDGLKRIKESEPDVILLDIMLPGLNGMEVCMRVRQFSDVPIIILTAKDETSDKVMGLDLGANDYITKPFATEELLARIRAVMRKNDLSGRQPKTLAIGSLVMDSAKHSVKHNGQIIDLTKREYDLLEYLMINKGIVLSREKLLEKVWGFDYSGDTNVVDVYIRYLRSKIDDPFHDKFIHTIRGVGYILKEGIDET